MSVATGVRIRVLDRAVDLPRHVHDQADAMLSAAYAEAGYPDVPTTWTGTLYVNDTKIPEDVLHRAAQLVCDRLGIAYEVVDECPDCGG